MSSQNFAVLDLGSQKATLAYFQGGKALKLKAIATSTIEFGQLVGPTKLTTLTQIIKGLAAQVQLPKNSVIRYSVPSQSVFVRFAKVSAISGANLKQLAGFELQQQLPVPMDQVAWDFHQIPSQTPESEVALVSARKQEVDDLHTVLTELGHRPSAANVSPVASLNALFANQGAQNSTTLLIEVREKTTNLIYTFGESFYTRSINFGLSTLTADLSKQMGLDEAQAQQWVAASIIPVDGVDVSAYDQTAVQIGGLIKGHLDRLVPQIAQTNAYFQSNGKGQPPSQIFLAGELAGVALAAENLQAKLGVQVQEFVPNAISQSQATLDPQFHGASGQKLSTIFGLAAQEAGSAFVNTELASSQEEDDNDFAKEKPIYFAATAMIAVGVIALLAAIFVKKGQYDEEVSGFDRTYRDLEYYHGEIEGLEKDQSDLEDSVEVLLGHHNRTEMMLRLVDQVAGHFNDDAIWLSDFAFVVNHSYEEDAEVQSGELILDDLKEVEGNRSIIKYKPVQTRRGRKSEAYVNALKLKGFWVDNDKGQDIVASLIDKLHDQCDDLTIEVEKGKKKKDLVRLENREIITYLENPTVNPDQSSWAFELIIPLTKNLEL